MLILVLEETLCVQSLSVYKELELITNFVHVLLVDVVWLRLPVEGLGSGVI